MIILTKKELLEALESCGDNDQVCIETTDMSTGDAIDLYPFYIDIIGGIKLNDGSIVNEIRFCQQPNI
jgi:hypothetical protein